MDLRGVPVSGLPCQKDCVRNPTLSRQNIEVLTNGRQSQLRNQRGFRWVGKIEHLKAAQLIEKINRRAIGLPDIRLLRGGRF